MQGGEIAIDSEHIGELSAAIAAFSSNLNDPKAAVENTYVFPGVSTSLRMLRKTPLIWCDVARKFYIAFL